jgi:hypothetical protein
MSPVPVHATDPDRLEQRIGDPASQGCVRAPGALTDFMNRRGVWTPTTSASRGRARAAAALRPDRMPMSFAERLPAMVYSDAAR